MSTEIETNDTMNTNLATVKIGEFALPNGMRFKDLQVDIRVRRTNDGYAVDGTIANSIINYGRQFVSDWLDHEKEMSEKRFELRKAESEAECRREDARTKAYEAEAEAWSRRWNRGNNITGTADSDEA